MTQVSSVGAGQTTTASPSSNSARIDPNSFLKLLVAELQYQDPTKPMDTTQLVQQLAAMSQVEQSAQTNAKLSSILDQLGLGQSSSLIGRTVTSADGSSQGIVSHVRVTDTGTVAGLEDGTELRLEQGVKVSR